MTFLICLGFALVSPIHAQGYGIARFLERPIARFLLTETAEGRALFNEVLVRKRGQAETRTPRDIRNFSRTFEEGFHWQDIAPEFKARVLRAEKEVERLMETAYAKGAGFDAPEFLREFAARELRLTRRDFFFRFAEAGEESLAAVRERFVAEMQAAEGRSAPWQDLTAALGKISTRIESLRAAAADPAALRETVDRLRGTAVEIAVQSPLDPSRYDGLRYRVIELRGRLSPLVERLDPRFSELQVELRETLAETEVWFPSFRP